VGDPDGVGDYPGLDDQELKAALESATKWIPPWKTESEGKKAFRDYNVNDGIHVIDMETGIPQDCDAEEFDVNWS